jgi:hypothetical protein
LRELPRERVFSPATSYEQNIHRWIIHKRKEPPGGASAMLICSSLRLKLSTRR